MSTERVYTTEEIQERIKPIAEQYGLRAVYLFGSYARGDATAESDVDLIVDTSGTGLTSLFKLGGLYCAFEDALQKKIDMITVDSIMQKPLMKSDIAFKKNVWESKVRLYAAA